MSGKGKGKAPAKGRGRGLQKQGQDQAQETPSTSAAATTSTTTTTGAPKAAGSVKRKHSEESDEESTTGRESPDLMQLVNVEPFEFRRYPTEFKAQRVRKLCQNFDSLIPPDEPALPHELDILKQKGFTFHFPYVTTLGEGSYGKIYECTFTWTRNDGKEFSKVYACKKVAINYPATRLDQPIREAENQMRWEIIICELLILNPHENVAKHKLVYLIRTDKTLIKYENPINHLIFMEQCQGDLENFVTQNFGYSTDQNYSGAPPEFVNKVWMRHVCQGLDFLHNAAKKSKRMTKELKKFPEWIAIIHHDLKHANVLYQMHNDHVKFMICDFGFSEFKTLLQSSDRKRAVRTSVTNGTERFLSPEVLELKEDLAKWHQQNPTAPFQPREYEGRKKDVYALGMMLHDCLIGFEQSYYAYPLADKWQKQSLYKNQPDDYRNSPLFAHVSPQCFDVMFRMLTPDFKQRPFIQDVLKDEWLNHEKFSLSTFVDIHEELQEAAKRIATGP